MFVTAFTAESRIRPAGRIASAAGRLLILIVSLVQAYARKRIARTSTIHGLAGMAAIAASTYKAYLGEGLGPLSFLKQLRIPHPGRVRPQMPCLRLLHGYQPGNLQPLPAALLPIFHEGGLQAFLWSPGNHIPN